MTTSTYRNRPVKVEAIRWTGPENCEEVFAFLGMEHPDDELDHSEIFGIGKLGENAEHGDWIVRTGDGNYKVYDDQAYREKYEAGDE